MTKDELEHLEWKHNVLNAPMPNPMPVVVTTTHPSGYVEEHYVMAYPVERDDS